MLQHVHDADILQHAHAADILQHARERTGSLPAQAILGDMNTLCQVRAACMLLLLSRELRSFRRCSR
eukprot:365131-Chlamydomonas_euryale.AAC.1